MGRVTKSLAWLIGTSILGYTLLLVTTPNDQILNQKYSTNSDTETLKTRQAFMNTIKAAAASQHPMYRQTKEQIEKELPK